MLVKQLEITSLQFWGFVRFGVGVFICLLGWAFFFKLSYFFTRIRSSVFCWSLISFTLLKSCLLTYLYHREYPTHRAISPRLYTSYTDIFAPCKHHYYTQLCPMCLSSCISSTEFHPPAIVLIQFRSN